VCQIKKFGVIVNVKEHFLKYIVFMDKTFLNIKDHINGHHCQIYESCTLIGDDTYLGIALCMVAGKVDHTV